MDMKEASAMTEASGLTDEQSSPSQEATMRWVDQLREATVRAPIQALFAAFLLGMWVARRR
jgi:hypothetical protein